MRKISSRGLYFPIEYYKIPSEGAVILGFLEAVSQHEWRTRICVRYRVTS